MSDTHCGFSILDFGLAGGLFSVMLLVPSASAATEKPDPSFLHGAGEVIDGIVLELPKTVLQGTLDGPPVVGTLIGALAGAARAGQKTVEGLLEMSSGFDPWGSKRKP